ncbi:AAA family ATPase [Streptomyces globisporus]|nr:AAA family ATPase [Streptomyces globisporus]
MAKIILPGFGLKGYRSFGADFQFSGRLGPVTLLAGQNNAGKSNFLRLLSARLTGKINLQEVDRHRGSESNIGYALAFDWETELKPALEEKNWNPSALQTAKEIVTDPGLSRDGLTWVTYDLDGNMPTEQFDPIIRKIGNSRLVDACRNMNSQYYSGSEIGAGRQNIHTIIRALLPERRSKGNSVITIEAFRKIQPLTDPNQPDGTVEGVGLLPRLQKLQNPPASTHDRDTARFQAINRFVKTILDDKTARLEVQHDAGTLNVHHGGRILPLENLGTGVHQVIILAVAATVNEDRIVCMEEPEVHLHPVYQRKFIRYLATETNNQYLIATHSAHLLDHQSASVLHVRHDGQRSFLEPAITPAQLSGVCADLGYRPSDLLQTNAVIWVEGPSDRIYLNHWIRQIDPDLIEGLHYSIMFYGGGLLNHLSASDEEIDDFIELRRLNRYVSIVIDSDRKSRRATINETKRRVHGEFDGEAVDGFSWITEGYTIENYIPVEILKAAVSEVHPGAIQEWAGDRWENPLSLKNKSGKNRVPDKNKIARTVCQEWTEPPSGRSHLGRMVTKCVSFIREANKTSANPVA